MSEAPWYGSSAYWTPLATEKGVAGGCSIDHLPMSEIGEPVPLRPMR